MALNYLLSPEFQVVNTAGKPATGGYLEVYISGSRERYYCASDFDGTLYPFHVPLDSLGSNVVLADDSHAYDVYVYNRYGGLLMSRYNVHPRSGGGIGINDITSSDGSIIVTQTANGVDLRTNSTPPSILRATAATLYADGQFVFSEAQRDGQNAIVDSQGKVIVNEGWWHYDATVRLRWTGPAQNETQSVSLYTQNASDSMTVDLSFAHSETVQVSGEYKALNDSTQFVLGVTGVPSGMIVELVDFGVHSIIGEGAGGKYEAGNGIVIDEPNRIISVDFDEVQEKLTAGTGITIDAEGVISVDESAINEIFPVTYDVTTVSEIRSALMAGKLPVLFLGDAADVAISVRRIPIHDFFDGGTYRYAQFWQPSVYTSSSPSYPPYANFAVYSVSYDVGTSETTWSTSYKYIAEQSDWAEADATKLTFIKNKPANLVQDANYVHTDNNYTDADVSKLAGIAAGAEVNVQSDWTESDTTADSYIQHKPTNLVQDASYVHTDNNFTTSLKDKLDGIASGAEVNVQSDWTEADNTADSYIQNKPAETTLTAGSNITITESGSTLTIAANVPAQQQANWTEADNTDPSYIQNKPTIPPDNVYVATYGTTTYQELSAAHTDGKAIFVTNVSGVLSAVIPMTSFSSNPAMVMFSAVIGSSEYRAKIDQGVWSSAIVSTQADWDEANQLAPSYIANKPTIVTPVNADWDSSSGLSEILNKPTEKSLVAGSNITLTEAANSVTIAATVPAQQQADWTESDNTSVSYIQNKPTLATVASSGSYTDLLNTPDLSLKEDVANKAQSIDTSSTTDYPSSKAMADYVNSSVSTNTAKFLGNFTLTDLSLTYPATDAQIETALDGYAFSPAPTNNDYVYVEIQDPQTPGVADVVKRFKFDGANWLYEYSLNNSSFTAAEIAAIDSGVTSTKVGNYDTHIADTTIHVTSTDKTTWNGKQDAISDLNTIRTGAGLGATAVQPGDLATVATSGLYSDLSGTPSLATVATSGDYDDLLNKPTIPAAQVQSNWTEADNSEPSYIQNKPTLATVATSGLYSDLSGTPSLATVATSGDYDDLINKPSIPAAQVQSNWTEADNTDPSYIQNKPSLAAVATSGLYSDLSGTPSLAAVATSGDYDDLLNKPSIPAAQVQSNWTESDNTDPSYIQNKPTLATVATSGLYSDLSGTPTINNVPAVTSSDDNKVLKASYTGGVGSYSWEQESGGTVTDVEVDGVSVVSGGVASITMPTDLVPAVTSSDDSKVLKASYTGGVGSYSWEAESGGTVTDVEVNGVSVVSGGVADITIPAQVQSDWSEADTTADSYIQNKPVPKTLVAGTGITITETANDLTVAATATSYTAGTGISISAQNVITNTGVAINKTTPELCGSFMGEPVYTKLYEFTGTVGTSDTTVNFTIDEVVATGSTVTRIWLDPSNSFIEYGSASVKLPLTYFLSSARHGSVFVVSQGAGTLSFRGVDTSSVGLTFFLAVKYTDPTP